MMALKSPPPAVDKYDELARRDEFDKGMVVGTFLGLGLAMVALVLHLVVVG
ncbi:MAG: hypothetical protein ACRBI6_04555 [Acidimicrobiales bacterium]